MAEVTGSAGEARDGRNAGRDERDRPGAGGDARGTSGFSRHGALRALLVIALFLLLVDTINVMTILHDSAGHGGRIAAWEPIVWESTSGVSTLVSCAIVYWALVRAAPGRTRWPVLVAVHAAASLAFSGLHVLLMNAMRVAIYAAAGHRYPFGASGFVYEYRKDLIAYIVIAGIFWLFAAPARGGGAVPAPAQPPRLFDIVEGSRVIRVPLDEIAALRAAGNYVEFLLADGRRPLMRGSLAEIHAAVSPAGFVRTHRSWAVNLTHVRGLRPAGSGDFQVELDGGTIAPVSRRFPDALARLREGGAPGDSGR
jgi:hypothetical protein